MVFSSVIFLSVFLPLSLLLCLLTRKHLRLQNGLLLLLSLGFYAWGEWRFLPVMAASAVLNSLLGAAASRRKDQKWPVVLAVAMNLGLLFYYKYAGFAAEVFSGIMGTESAFAAPALPLGISFFTFQGLSYVLDMHRNGEPETRITFGNCLDVCLYICFFPQLVAGPIVRWNEIREEIRERRITWEGVEEGLLRFIPGLAKKVLLADTVGKLADAAFSCPDGNRGVLLALAGGAAFCLQLYLDFSGYSDMAIGLGKIFGFRFPENFREPYRSTSMQEFWRRWHISLSGWFRDYVYIPLGGSRRGRGRTALNTMIVFCLTGIWHGAGWTFLIWGIWNGLFVALEQSGALKPGKWPKILRALYTLAVVLLGFIVFRADTLSAAAGYLGSLFRFSGDEAVLHTFLYALSPERLIALAAALLVCFGPRIPEKLRNSRIKYPVCLALLALCYLSVVSSGYHPFLYFRF